MNNSGKDMPRSNSHITETKTRIIFEEAVTSYSSKDLSINEGGLVYREVTEKDYGVDGELEIFEDDEVTGKQARIQLKGTNKIIEKLKTADFVSCSNVSKSSLGYCRTNNIPFVGSSGVMVGENRPQP